MTHTPTRPLLAAALLGAALSASAATHYAYFGCYTGPKSKGIHMSRWDARTGQLTAPELAVETINPSFLAVHPNQKWVYAAGEGGPKGGTVSAFAVDPATGKLTLLNEQSSKGNGPCHLVVDHTGKNVLVANYGGGSIAVLPLAADGQLQPASAFVQHEGSGPNKRRQEKPHAHFIDLDPANRRALVCDLGLDKVMIYQFDPAAGTLKPNDPPFGTLKPGAGPRHFAWHPNGRIAWVINELDSTVTTLMYDAVKGSLQAVASVSTLPSDFTGNTTTAEIVVHPSGKFVYGSNRGHDSVAVFAAAEGGKLTPVETVSTQGKNPRFIGLDPTGKWLLAANQTTDNVVVYQVDGQTGRLTATGTTVTLGAPVCIQFVPIR
jgi:6-phosphogluconolactonase